MRLLALKVVLVATDLDESSLAAIATARALAIAADAELHVVHVTSTPDADSTGVHELLARAEIPLNEASVHAMAGDPSLVIGKLADEISADVIVLGPHRPGTDAQGKPRLDTALAIVTNSAAPCLVANELSLPLTRVLVAVDLSDTSRGAMVVALSWASALRGSRARTTSGAALTVLHVAKRDADMNDLAHVSETLERQLESLREDAGSWANVVVESDIITGDDIPESVARYAAEHGAQLVVLGTRGLGLDDVGRVGSVAGAAARASKVPVLLVPPAIWLELGQIRPHRSVKRA
jgi:nucleotide-binding universal stress UspA family protein